MQHWVRTYGAERVCRAFFCVELFPYASKAYRPLKDTVPSQAYSLSLARAKIRAGCVVVVMRKHREWLEALTAEAE